MATTDQKPEKRWDPDLPDGWTAWSSCGDVFYHHEGTNTQQWERPSVSTSPLAPQAPAPAPAALESTAAAKVQGNGNLPPDEGNPWLDMDDNDTPGLDFSSVSFGGKGFFRYPPSDAERHWKGKGFSKGAGGSSFGSAARGRSPFPFDRPPPPGCPGGHLGSHVPCLLMEAVDELTRTKSSGLRKAQGFFVDCTFGRGGHTREILSRLAPEGRLFAFDVDPSAIAVANELEGQDHRFRIIHRPFADLSDELKGIPLSGVLMDLGVSSPQLDERHRGFSVTEDAPVDLRMNQQHGIPAAEWLRYTTVEELTDIIYRYGEDDDNPIVAERIAEAIMHHQRTCGPINSTRKLADIVRVAKNGMDDRGQHPAKLTFQAIRIFLNQEMEQLDMAMKGAFELLEEGGYCCIISFKRKEANAIRKFATEHEEPPLPPDRMLQQMSEARVCELYPLVASDKPFCIRCQGEVKPSKEEIDRNWRCRSSVVHVLQKVARRWPKFEKGAAEVRDWSERKKEPKFKPTFQGAPTAAHLGHESFLYAVAEAAAKTHTPRSYSLAEPVKTSGSASSSDPVHSSLGFGPHSADKVDPDEPWKHDKFDAGGATEAMAPSPQPEAAPGLAGDKSNPRCHRVLRSYTVAAGVEGYLTVMEGQDVEILYEGTSEEEAGWAYGMDAQNQTGWFPLRILEP